MRTAAGRSHPDLPRPIGRCVPDCTSCSKASRSEVVDRHRGPDLHTRRALRVGETRVGVGRRPQGPPLFSRARPGKHQRSPCPKDALRRCPSPSGSRRRECYWSSFMRSAAIWNRSAEGLPRYWLLVRRIEIAASTGPAPGTSPSGVGRWRPGWCVKRRPARIRLAAFCSFAYESPRSMLATTATHGRSMAGSVIHLEAAVAQGFDHAALADNKDGASFGKRHASVSAVASAVVITCQAQAGRQRRGSFPSTPPRSSSRCWWRGEQRLCPRWRRRWQPDRQWARFFPKHAVHVKDQARIVGSSRSIGDCALEARGRVGSR